MRVLLILLVVGANAAMVLADPPNSYRPPRWTRGQLEASCQEYVAIRPTLTAADRWQMVEIESVCGLDGKLREDIRGSFDGVEGKVWLDGMVQDLKHPK